MKPKWGVVNRTDLGKVLAQLPERKMRWIEIGSLVLAWYVEEKD